MKLIVLFFIVTFRTSWQQNRTDTLNETLDMLIKQIDLVNRIDNNNMDNNLPKNSSKIIYINQDSERKPEKETKLNVTSFKSDDVKKKGLIDILRALSITNNNDNDDTENNTRGITLTVENNTQPRTRNINSAKVQESSIEQLKSKSGRPAELDTLEDPIRTFIAETENNLYYQNPEIIIDRITYHNDKNKHEGVIEKLVDKDSIDQNDYPIIAQELQSIMNELQKLNAEETASENNVLTHRSDFTSYVPSVVVNRGAIQQPCANVLVSYSFLCNNMLLRKLRGYQNLLNGARDLDTSLKLNWGARDGRPDALMRTSRTGELNRIHFISHLIKNRMSKFGYQPLYG